MTRALGMHCGRGHQCHHPLGRSILSAPCGLGPSHFGAGGMRHFLLGLCKALQLKTIPPAHPLAPAHSLPLPCSLLTLLWHHTLSVLSAAGGAQVPSVQHYQRLFCALKVPRGSRGSLAGTGVWLVADSILVPRAWSCASTPRAAGCRWRPSTLQPSGYGDGDGDSPWVPLGGRVAREDIPRLWTCPCA